VTPNHGGWYITMMTRRWKGLATLTMRTINDDDDDDPAVWEPDLHEEGVVAAFGYGQLIVEERKDPHRPALQHLQHVAVVLEANLLHEWDIIRSGENGQKDTKNGGWVRMA
jgi:hypothetical protein